MLSYSHLSLLMFGICRCLLIYGGLLQRGKVLTLYPKWTCLERTQTTVVLMLLPLLRGCFEKIVYHTQAQSVIENNLSHTQFAYRQAGNCINVLLAIQHQTYKYLDSSDCSAVGIFIVDFSKAFDFVNHTILSTKLKQLPLNPYIIHWYLSFLYARQQHVVSYNFFRSLEILWWPRTANKKFAYFCGINFSFTEK